ncbi:serine--tRNA ligase [Candidatus Sumerlaeota bacterium]|nr:serine--tRNA ligase [Candidatus Sumerlaeota bacterium]
MIDVRLLRDDPDSLRRALEAKNESVDLDRLIELDGRRRELAKALDEMNRRRNEQSKTIGSKIKAGQDADALRAEVRALGEKIKAAESESGEVDTEYKALLLQVPNRPHSSTPLGRNEEDNKVLSEWGEKPSLDFEPKPHWELGEKLGILDLAAGAKIAGSGFPLWRGAGAALQRALINWMIDVHTTKHGYTEIAPPYLVTSDVLTGTGQLPKLADDMYRIEAEDLWLIPTAEVPVTNLHREEILAGDRLPIRYCAYTPCFRREAGSYGREVRGITRVHQFDKVEMVQIVRPEESPDALEKLRSHAETLLQDLGLHYRVLELCTGELSFASSRTYDLEVWAPGMDLWLEVSSCSNFEDFQARRAGIRFRPEKGAKPRFVHTLNGSGLALPRTVIALMETFQQPDGSIRIPEALRPYFGADSIS